MRLWITGALIAFCLGSTLDASERSVQRLVSMEYPDLAIQARMQGEIVVECAVDTEGRVTTARVVRADQAMTNQDRSLLGTAAMENVKQWRFQKGSDPTTVQVVYRFSLEDQPTRRRTTRFVFEFPNTVYVSSQYMSLVKVK